MENISLYVRRKNKELDSCKDKNFATLFELIHNQDDKIFAQFSCDGLIKSVKYSEIKQSCYKFASFLKEKISCQQNSFVGIYMENSIEWVVSFWSLLMIGYRPVLLNCKLPTEINNGILKTLNCDTVITSSNAKYNELNSKIIYIEEFDENKYSECNSLNWADELAICTTASSLNYKICVYAGENVFNQLFNAKQIIGSYCPRIRRTHKGKIKILAFLPFYHIFGLFATYFWFSLYGRTIIFLNDYSSQTIIKTIQKFEVTHIFSVPMFWNTLAREINKQISRQDQKLQDKFKKWQTRSIKMQNVNLRSGSNFAKRIFKEITEKTLGKSVHFIISGGGYISDETMHLLNSLGYPLLNGYGTTEIGIIAFENRNKPKYRLLSSVGKNLNTVQCKVVDGCLWVKGTSTCKYFYYKDGTRVDLNNDWFNTNDIAKIDDRGYIYILGRKDDVIIKDNGEKINPDLIEKQLSLKTVSNFVIFQVNNKTTLIIQLNKKPNSLISNEIMNDIDFNINKLNASGYTIDQVCYTYDQLAPKNAIKVSRTILKNKLQKNEINLKPISDIRFIQSLTKEETNNEVANIVKDIVANVLNIKADEILENQNLFFDLGCTSLDYFTIITSIQDEFDIKIEFREEGLSNVKQFADYILARKVKK